MAQTKELQSGESSKIVNQQSTQKDVEKKQKELHESMPSTVLKHCWHGAQDLDVCIHECRSELQPQEMA